MSKSGHSGHFTPQSWKLKLESILSVLEVTQHCWALEIWYIFYLRPHFIKVTFTKCDQNMQFFNNSAKSQQCWELKLMNNHWIRIINCMNLFIKKYYFSFHLQHVCLSSESAQLRALWILYILIFRHFLLMLYSWNITKICNYFVTQQCLSNAENWYLKIVK